jgi:FkbM family methyltransferase
MIRRLAKLANMMSHSMAKAIFNISANIVYKFKKNYKIKYRGYDVFLGDKDKSSAIIYFRYLIHKEWRHEMYQQNVVDAILSLVDRFYFIDAGCNYGLYSLLACSHNNKKLIVSLDVSRGVYEQFKKTINENNLDKYINLKRAAISNKMGEFYTTNNIRMLSEWTQAIPATDGVKDKDKIKSITIDHIINEYMPDDEALFFIKMDIEGGEPLAFEGMHDLFHSRKKYVVLFEFHTGLLQDPFLFAKQIFKIHQGDIYYLRGDSIKRIKDYDAFAEIVENMQRQSFPGNLCEIVLSKDITLHFAAQI